MILDDISNAAQYYSLNPRLERAFEWLRSTDLDAIEFGKHQIDGDEIFANVSDTPQKPYDQALLELHRRYIDIQVLVSGAESEEFGWRASKDCHTPTAEADTAKDIQFFSDVPTLYFTLRRGMFCLLLPTDGHAPMIGTAASTKKIIIKVRA